MQRKEFLVTTGIFITTAMFNNLFANPFNFLFGGNSTFSNPYDRRPNPEQLSEPILKAIAIGVNAPSSHNTQSWKFKVLNELEMELYVDENRVLPAVDPFFRQIHIGMACFAETLKIGITKYGYDAQVSYLPNGYELPKDLGNKPVAKIFLSKTEKNLIL